MKSVVTKVSSAILAITLAACASAPTGPSVAVMPGDGKSFEQFNEDDLVCRQYASNQNSGAVDSTNNKAIGTAALGALIGAAAGAAIGNSHQGAGAGAGIGLLAGSAVGTGEAQNGTNTAQRSYDISYSQCMYAKGNSVPTMR